MFSRREWLMFLSILLMLEAWILNASYSFRGDQDVINYISFASTIASLLLAVIAIIYGFYQSDGQKKSSAAIEYQLESMRSIQGGIGHATSELVSHLKQIASMTGTLKSISDSIESTHTKIGSIEGNLSSLKEAQDIIQKTISPNKPKSAATPLTPEQAADAAARILRGSSFQADIIGYSLNRAFLIAKSNRIPLWEFMEKFIEYPLGKVTTTGFSASEWRAMALQVILVLVAMNFLKLNLDNDDSSKTTLEISEELLGHLQNYASATKGSASLTHEISIIDRAAWSQEGPHE